MTRATVHFMTPGLSHKVDLFLVERGQGFNAGAAKRARMPAILALDSLSDRELALIGMRPEDIPATVFADLLAA